MSATPNDPVRDPELAKLMQTRLSAPPLRPGFHDELEARLQSADAAGREAGPAVVARRRRFAGRRLIAAAAVAAAAAIFAFAVLPALRGAATATAADMLASMSAASGHSQTVRLHIVSESTADLSADNTGVAHKMRQVETAGLTMGVNGDLLAAQTGESSTKAGQAGWKNSPPISRISTFDAGRHEQRSGWSVAGSKSDHIVIRRPAWPVDVPASDMSEIDYESLAASLRAELAATDPDMPVEETTYLGRPAWRADLVERWHLGVNQDMAATNHWDVTVDKATGLLMAATYRMEVKGKAVPFTVAMHVTRMEVDPRLPRNWQLMLLPATGPITVVDESTRFGTPEQVAKLSWPTLPLVPQWAPAGYRLTDVASAGWAAADTTWTPSSSSQTVGRSGRTILKRASWAQDGQTVLVRLRRGFSTFVVQITPKAFGEEIGAGDAAGERGAELVTLTKGYLKGSRAVTTITPYQEQGPMLIAYSGRSKVVIWGDLTRDELIAVANSMKVYGDVDRGLMPGYGD